MNRKIIKPKRNEIYMADLPVTSDSVQYGRRPVLIIQNDIGNTYSPTTIVVPLTSQQKREMPTHVKLGIECGLGADSTVLCEQIMTVAINTLEEKMGEVRSKTVIEKINAALRCSIDLDVV